MNGPSDATWIGGEPPPAADLRQRFRAVASLSKQDIAPAAFFQTVLRMLGEDVAASWAAVWMRTGTHWHRVAQQGGPGAATEPEITTAASAAIAETFAAEAAACHRQLTAHGVTLLTLPVKGEVPVVLQVALLPIAGNLSTTDAPRPSVDLAQELLEAYGQLSEDYDRNQSLQRLRARLASQQHWIRRSNALHASLDLDRTAYEIVAAVVAATGCERASLLARQRSGFHTLAVSGVATLDHRAPILRSLRQLAHAVEASGEMLVHAADDRPLAPQLAQPLNAYLDLAHAPCLLVLPLRADDAATDNRPPSAGLPRQTADTPGRSDSCGILVVESSDPKSLPSLLQQFAEISGGCAIALSNAQLHSTLPLRRTAVALRRLGDVPWVRGGRAAGAIAALLILIAVLVFVPAPLKIEAPGTLQPLPIHNAFAPRDGYVSEVWVQHDQPVSRGALLLTLHAPELELEMRRTEGAIESTEMELRATEAARRRGGQATNYPRDEAGGFAADETRLQVVLESYRQQLAMLRDEQAALAIHSPVDGYVLSWQVRQTLLGRPVQRGQRLLQLAATNSQWTLALEVPDRDAGHLLTAQARLRPDLAVDYVLATDPQRRHQGRVIDVARITEISDKGLPVVETIVGINSDAFDQPRAGAQVRARIDCGRHPLGYVWFHHLWDTVWSFVRF